MPIYKHLVWILTGILLSGICRGQIKLPDTGHDSVYRKSWKVIGPGGGGGVLKPTVSPLDDNFVLTHCDMTSVYVSRDIGKSWISPFDERVRVHSAGLDPEHPEKVFINTFQNAAYRSDDSGTTWKRIEGYRFKWGQRAISDINNPGMLFLTTYGGSVYYGPATGDPYSTDDIVNMPE